MATDAQIAAHLDLTDRSVRSLKAKGVLPSAPRGQLDPDACRLAYIRHLRGVGAGRDSSRPGSLEAERARLAAAQAEAQERKNAKERGELVERSVMEQVMEGAVSLMVSRLGRIGARVARRDVKLRARIETEIHDVLEDLIATSDADILTAAKFNSEGADDDDDEE